METIKKPWITIERLIIAILVLLLLLQQQCNGNGKAKVVYEARTDTATVIKTVVELDTVLRYIPLKVPKPSLVVTDSSDTLKKYTQTFEDSLIKGVFTSLVKGKLMASDFKYKPKFPKKITTTINNTITNTVDKPIKNMLFVNAIISGNSKVSDIGLGLSFYQKKGYLYTLNYFPITKTANIGFSYQLK